MSNHLHFIVAADDGLNLSDTLRYMEKFTSKRIVKEIQEELESRQKWMLHRFAHAGKFGANVRGTSFGGPERNFGGSPVVRSGWG